MLRISNFIRKTLAKRVATISNPAIQKKLFLQKRRKVDAAYDLNEFDPTGAVLAKFASAPVNSAAHLVFDALVACGRIKLMDPEANGDSATTYVDGDSADLSSDPGPADDGGDPKKISRVNLPQTDIKTLPKAVFSSSYIGASSQWRLQQAASLCVFDRRKITYTPSLTVPEHAPTLRRILTFPQCLKDPRYDVLNTDDPKGWEKAVTKLLTQDPEDVPHHQLAYFFGLLLDLQRQNTREVLVDQISSALLAFSSMNGNIVSARAKQSVSINLAGYGGSQPLVAIYDHAILSTSLLLILREKGASLSPIARLLAFIIEDKIGAKSPGVDGQLVAEMIVQAASNYGVFTNFQAGEPYRSEPHVLIFPKEVRDGDVYYSTAFRVTGHVVSVYRAEIPSRFLYALLTDPQTPADKFVVREVASPSGKGFNLLLIDDLRALVDLMASFSLSCHAQLTGIEGLSKGFPTKQ